MNYELYKRIYQNILKLSDLRYSFYGDFFSVIVSYSGLIEIQYPSSPDSIDCMFGISDNIIYFMPKNPEHSGDIMFLIEKHNLQELINDIESKDELQLILEYGRDWNGIIRVLEEHGLENHISVLDKDLINAVNQ